MSRSQQIRDALTGSGDVPLAVIMSAIEAPEHEEKQVRNIISALRTQGQIENGAAPDTFRLGAVKPKRAPAERKKLREIADKAKQPPAKLNGSLHTYALQHLFATGEHLRIVLREQIDGLDGNDCLRTAIALHESAEQLAKGSAP